MIDHDALSQLGAGYGIVQSYYDIWGGYHPVSPATQQALLRAMGIDTRDDDAVQQALERLENQVWQRLLAPVMVVAESVSVAINITVPAELEQARFDWTLTQEDGAELGGDWCPAELERLEERTITGKLRLRCCFSLPRTPAPGYHQLRLQCPDHPLEQAGMSLIVTPRRCYQPPELAADQRLWGIALQLYAVRSQRNWGMGDFSDLITAVDTLAELGVAVIGLNPLHVLYPHKPSFTSPYSPSSRLFLNPLYLDVEAIADFAECESARYRVREPAFQAELEQLRAVELIDYPAVAKLKFVVLRQLYAHFRQRHLELDSERGQGFREFQAKGGSALQRHVLFEALQAHFSRLPDQAQYWTSWPEAYRDPNSNQVKAFATEQGREIEFYCYLQWQTDLQLQAVAARAAERGLSIGLYRDLAVGSDRSGAEHWANQSIYARGAHIGAPPDDFSPTGQNWGLPPLIPERLRQSAYQAFIATLRANMRYAGALRIDHVMGLMRLFWVPPGMTPNDGAYINYPFTDLLGILALESQRNRCLIVGEDLGTVPDEVRAALYDYGVLSYRVFYFEKYWHGDHSFKQPHDYPVQALVTASTHDLPTLVGFWHGSDLQLRAELELFPNEAVRDGQFTARAEDRGRLLHVLQQQGLQPGAVVNEGDPPSGLAEAVHDYLASTPAQIMMVQMEDVFEQPEQINLPGTTEQYPNWRRKLSLNLEDWRQDGRMEKLSTHLNRERDGLPVRQGFVDGVER